MSRSLWKLISTPIIYKLCSALHFLISMLCLFYYSWRASSYPPRMVQTRQTIVNCTTRGERYPKSVSDITWYRRIELLTYPYLTFLSAMTQNECKYSWDVKVQKTVGCWSSVIGNQQVIGSLAKWLSVIGHCWSRGPTTSKHRCYNISAYDSSLFPRPSGIDRITPTQQNNGHIFGEHFHYSLANRFTPLVSVPMYTWNYRRRPILSPPRPASTVQTEPLTSCTRASVKVSQSCINSTYSGCLEYDWVKKIHWVTYRVTHLVANPGWADFDLGSSPTW